MYTLTCSSLFIVSIPAYMLYPFPVLMVDGRFRNHKPNVPVLRCQCLCTRFFDKGHVSILTFHQSQISYDHTQSDLRLRLFTERQNTYTG